MGRYYSGDIDGKFWFGVQDSDDAEFFGCEGEPVYDDYDDLSEEEPDDGKAPYALAFRFEKEDLESIDEGIMVCLQELGEYKEKLDAFFNEGGKGYSGYNTGMITEDFDCDEERAKRLVEYYARLELGVKIKKCVEETGQCCFDAEL